MLLWRVEDMTAGGILFMLLELRFKLLAILFKSAGEDTLRVSRLDLIRLNPLSRGHPCCLPTLHRSSVEPRIVLSSGFQC